MLPVGEVEGLLVLDLDAFDLLHVDLDAFELFDLLFDIFLPVLLNKGSRSDATVGREFGRNGEAEGLSVMTARKIDVVVGLSDTMNVVPASGVGEVSSDDFEFELALLDFLLLTRRWRTSRDSTIAIGRRRRADAKRAGASLTILIEEAVIEISIMSWLSLEAVW